MGFRRRTRRRALIAGAAVAHHEDRKYAEAQQVAPAVQAPAEQYEEPAPVQYAPPPVDPADQVEHLAELHSSGVLSDEEFAAAKAKALGI